MPDPYNISLNPETGFYNFRTEQGLIYGCKFSRITSLLSPVLGVYDIEVHDFIFYPYDPHPAVKKPHDERVSATLQSLVTGYFITPVKALTYLCDFSDGLGEQRARLFSQWANRMDVMNHYQAEVSIAPFKANVGVLTRKDFPYPDVLQTELIQKTPGILVEKFG